jgi:hypothetical protein
MRSKDLRDPALPLYASQRCQIIVQGTNELIKALEQVRSWKIVGQHLELYDAGGTMLARFEATG